MASTAAAIIRRVDDVRRALPAVVRAFWDFPETVHLLPDERRRRHVLPRYLATDMRDSQRFGGLHVAERDGNAVGAIAWLPPTAYPIALARQLRQLVALLPTLPWGWAAAMEGQRGSAENQAVHRAIGEPHYFVRVLGVEPGYQRRGIGRELMRGVLQRADGDGLGTFLFTSTEANAAWYGSLGFETTQVYNPTPTWPDVWAMWRAPR